MNNQSQCNFVLPISPFTENLNLRQTLVGWPTFSFGYYAFFEKPSHEYSEPQKKW
jgi:hypothetical protein